MTDASYYGYRDDDNEILEKLEGKCILGANLFVDGVVHVTT